MARVSTAPMLFLGALLWVLFPNMQLAAENKLFERRFISRDAAFSDCIGTPTTPTCALDTLEACMLRRLPRLCELVGLRDQRFRAYRLLENNHYAYRILFIRRIERRMIENLPKRYFWARPGNVEIEFISEWCDSLKSCEVLDDNQTTVFLTQYDGRWRIAGWVSDSGDTYCEHYQPDSGYDRECELVIPEPHYLSYVRLNPLPVDPGFKKLYTR